MKYKCFKLLFFVFFAYQLSAQTEEVPPPPPTDLLVAPELKKPEPPNDKVYELFELTKLPEFPGGEKEVFNFIAKELQYPVAAREKHISGTVLLSFLIDKAGRVRSIQIIRDIGGGCGKEALRVISKMPPWTPGEVKGEIVQSRYSLPISFRFH